MYNVILFMIMLLIVLVFFPDEVTHFVNFFLKSLSNLLSLKKNLFVCVPAKVFLAALPIQMCFCDSTAEVTSGFVLRRSHCLVFPG